MSVQLEEDDYIYLTCIKEKSKLRVRILTSGYFDKANCQFPRDLRIEGRYFKVHKRNVKLITTRGKYYYCVKSKHDIEIIDEIVMLERELSESCSVSGLKIYEDQTQEECLICCDAKKDIIFYPCGHFYTCKTCSPNCSKCPICRVKVEAYINKEDME